MRAAELTAAGEFRLVEVPTPGVQPGHALVKVLACGICGSDQNAWRGIPGVELPLAVGAPGHEVWGEVAALGEGVSGLAVGQRVTGLAERGYAEFVLTPAEHLVPLTGRLAAQAPLLGEPLACAANALRRSAIQPEQRVAFVGFGYIAALMAALLDPSVEWVAVSRRPESLALARGLGASATASFDDVPSNWWDSFPVVVEAAGVQRALDYATWLTAYSGRLVIAGYHADGQRSVDVQSWNWKGIDVVNAHERRPEAYMRGLRAGLALVEQYDLDLSGLVTHRWPLEQVAAALATADARPADYVKGVVEPWSR